MSSNILYLFTFSIIFPLISFGQIGPAPDYMQGKAFPDSVMNEVLTQTDGKKIKLGEVIEEAKGETVVLWFWASWCGDSHKDLSKLRRLQRKLRNQDITFLLLSKDKSHEAWKKILPKLKVEGQHYRLARDDADQLKAYVDLDWIPRYVVLDEKGKVVVDKAVKGNDKELKSALLQ